ncbi:MAG: methyltransferase domain-containing protein [Hyphomonadaceae bacterium]
MKTSLRQMKYIAAAVLGAGLTACASVPATAPFEVARLSAPPIDYAALLTHPERPLDDFKDDTARRPDEILAFAGLEHGMTVVEIEAGAGYYTELLSYGVGPEGNVFMQNPLAFDGFFGDAIAERLADDRLANVQAVRTNFDVLTVADNSADIVTWFLGPHELWFRPDGAPEEAFGNPQKAFAEIARVMKPEGVFVAIDHVAPAGSPVESGSETHRIDPAIITQFAEAAGLTLADSTDILANPDDDGTLSVFDPSLRRKTNRVVLKFRHAAP